MGTASATFSARHGGALAVSRLIHQFELGEELYRQIARRCAFDDFVDIVRASPKAFAKIDTVACQPAVMDVFRIAVES